MRCPKCGAGATQPCETKSGKDHPERTKLILAGLDERATPQPRPRSKWDPLPGEVAMPPWFRERVRVASGQQAQLDLEG